jgi:peptidoglycan hydrolase FlgJ
MVEVYSASQQPLPPTVLPTMPAGNGLKRQNTALKTSNSQPPLGMSKPVSAPVLNGIAPKDPDKKAKDAAQQFEAVFINQLLQQLDKTIDRSNSMLNGGHAEDTFRGMMMQELATQISHKPGGSGFGLSDAIYRQIKQQEATAANKPAGPGLPVAPNPVVYPPTANASTLRKPVGFVTPPVPGGSTNATH